METRFATPKLRFPEFANALAWPSEPLHKKCDVVRGGSPRPIDAYLTNDQAGLNWLKIGDLDRESKYVRETSERVVQQALSKTRVVHPGDFILSNSMSFGRPYISEIQTCIHDGWIALTNIADELNREYLYYAILAGPSQRYFTDQAAGSGVQNLNIELVKALSVPIPSPAEQEKIADCLTSLDELIAAEGRKLDALREHKKALMQDLFPREGETTPRLRFPEFRDAPEWDETTLGGLVRFQSGGTPSKADADLWNGTIPWVSAKDMKALILDDTEDHITPEASSRSAKEVPAGTVLLLTRGMTLLRDLPVCLTKRPMSFNQDVKALRPSEAVTGPFLAYLLLAEKARVLCMVDIAGHGTGRLDTEKLKALVTLVPQLHEQVRIAECLWSLDALVRALQDKLATLKSHKQGLMQGLFLSLDATV